MAPDSRGWFAVPPPVRRLFKLFPLRVYPAEPLPHGAPATDRPRPSLYVFADPRDALAARRPSFNPSCLKWQALLALAGVDVDLVPSNNHASPSGALPFLLPPSQAPRADAPLTGHAIYKYARDNASRDIADVSGPRAEAYQALLTQSLRPAWLHALYLVPANAALLADLYLPSSPLLRRPLHRTLRTAATAEILKATRRAIVTPDLLYADATEALGALSQLLADDDWFFGSDAPSLFDAEVFSYTYLMLDETLAWEDRTLAECLLGFDNLLRHRRNLYDRCWREKT